MSELIRRCSWAPYLSVSRHRRVRAGGCGPTKTATTATTQILPAQIGEPVSLTQAVVASAQAEPPATTSTNGYVSARNSGGEPHRPGPGATGSFAERHIEANESAAFAKLQTANPRQHLRPPPPSG